MVFEPARPTLQVLIVAVIIIIIAITINNNNGYLERLTRTGSKRLHVL